MNYIKILAVLAMAVTSAMIPQAADADNAASVTISRVAQRWPWNNKVDIAYTVDGGQTRSSGVYCGIRFSLTAGGNTYDIPGYKIGASAENGSHIVTWTAPTGIVTADGTITATLFTTNVPSGNDYMIVDLASGDVFYEGLLASQEESNSRYNVPAYKTDKLVLRKVPRWIDRDALPNAEDLAGLVGYPTGTADINEQWRGNSSANWATERAYYIGIFPVTQYQYEKIGADAGSTPSGKKAAAGSGDVKAHRPVENVSWDDLRLASTSSTSSIPAVASSSGTFFQRLNHKSGLYFDLPTEVMFEIAERAGADTIYYWGDTMNTDYVVCSDNSASSTVAVGSRLPNAWGLYDMAGNTVEWCLDATLSKNMSKNADAFIPAWSAENGNRRCRGGHWNEASTGGDFKAYIRGSNSSSTRYDVLGFRVSLVAE